MNNNNNHHETPILRLDKSEWEKFPPILYQTI